MRTRRWSALALALLMSTAPACTAEQPEVVERGEPSAAAPSGRACRKLDELVERTRRGYVPVRSAEISPIPAEPNYIGKASLPVHTGPWDYLSDVPLVFYGPGVVARRGSVDHPVTLADLAPTTARLIGADSFDAPDGTADNELRSGVKPPRLVVTIVWDGAGWNTLREHRGSWPTLRRFMREGTSYSRATIGSTPSNTPPIHTTIGTGAFPRTHGIPHVKMRTASGGYVDPYEGDDASAVRAPTLGDVYDEATGNRPEVGVVATVNWHLGMIGHGAAFEGGDRDVAVLLNDQGLGYGNAEVYDRADPGDMDLLDTATDRLDQSDGTLDDRWNEDDLTDPALRYATPAFTDYQQQILERVIEAQGFGRDEVPDLMYVNFKQIDDAGHRWGMTSDQVGLNVAAADKALAELTRFLDDRVGEDRWAVAVTADHGQTLYPKESGGWPITGSELNADIERAFEDEDEEVEVEVRRVTSAGVFLKDPDALQNGTADKVAEWMGDYTVRENVPDDQELPKGWEDRGNEPLFSAVLAGREVVASACPPE